MQRQTEHTIWVEKHRPNTLENYVASTEIKEQFSRYVEQQDIPHLLLWGQKPGTGKTTLAKMISKLVDADVLYVNASYENKIETIRDRIVTFASTFGMKKLKIVILDEADYITTNGQAALRNVMEQFSMSTRFILTCNYVERILEPVVSRCQVIQVIPPSKREVAIHLMGILKKEGVTAQPAQIATIVSKSYPDIRKAIQLCQQFSANGVLTVPEKIVSQEHYVEQIIDALTQKASSKVLRQIIADAGISRFEELYTELHKTVEVWSTDIASDIITIATYAYKDAFVIDKELNVAAMLVSLSPSK